jgi:HSP20 family protein
MATVFADPFNALFQFQQALDAFRTSGWLGSGPSSSGAYPPLNVFRQGDDIVLITELPGIRKSALDIQVKANTIRIAGSKAVHYGDAAALHRRERLAGRFDRAITVPVEVDADRVKAEYRDGILALYLPRAERDKPKSMDPLYTEYNIRHFARSFTLSNKIDQQKISAQLDDGVLTLTLKKAKEAMPRRIAIS